MSIKNFNNPVVFYDGFCPLCHYWVRYLIKIDNNKSLYFAPIQGKFGASFVNKNSLENIDSLIFYNPKKQFYIYSESIFEILKFLKQKTILYFLISICPACISDIIYKILANNRYKIFKPFDNCKIPSKEVLSRIIN